MEYREIEIFRAVFDQGSITAAARYLGVSQPAVSTTLARFEQRLGFNLFRRIARRIEPTPEAKLLHAEANQLLERFQQFGTHAEQIATGRRGTLVVATNPNVAISWMPTVAAGFRQGRPDVRLRFLTRSSEEIRELTAASGCNLGIAEAPFENAALLLHRYQIPRVIILPQDHPLVSHETLTPKLLGGEDMIAIRRPGSWNWAAVVRAFESENTVCRVVAECEFASMALNMVGAGAGLCLVDAISASTIGPELVQRPFLPALHYEVGILCAPHGPPTILTRMFVEAVHDHITSYLKGA